MHKYPSGIDRSQFAIIAPILEFSCKITSHRNPDLYDVCCEILYVLKSGYQWRMMLKDYPNCKILVTIIFDAGVREQSITQKAYLKMF